MKQMKQIYLDWASGRRNQSSLHAEGVAAAHTLQVAREKVATVLTARPDEIIFTSGGTESNNLAIFGLAQNVKHRMFNILSTQIEHASVLEPARRLKATFLPVDQDGIIDLRELEKALRQNTTLVSIIYAHNEIGVIQPIRAIAKVIRKSRQKNNSPTPYFHIDACQAPRFLDLNVQRLGVDLMTLNGAKISEPGVGVLYVRRGVPLVPYSLGGGQENGRRSGTENVKAIANFASAFEKCAKHRDAVSKRVAKLRDYFIFNLLKISGVTLNGSRQSRLPNNVSVSFQDLDGEQIVLELDAQGVACSTGAACSAPERDASYVIMALGGTRARALGTVRFTLGAETTKSDVDYVLKILYPIIVKLSGVKNLNKII